MKKRLLSFVMAAAMLFGSAAALPEGAFSFETGIVASADSTSGVWKNSLLPGNNVKWQIKETQAGKTLILSGEGKTIVDSYWGNYLIADGHWNPAGITDIIVGKGISTINTYAFSTADSDNYYLKSITISDSVKEINGSIDGMWSHADGPQSQCVIYYASTGSAAQTYAEKNGFQNSICEHEYEEISIAPTCLDQGYTAQRCKKCFDTYGYVYSDELGHDYTETVIAPSCTAKGYTIHTCSRCKDKYIDSETDKIAHNYGSWAVTSKPTCTKNGVETRTCKTCGASQTREVETLGHNYESTVVSPTCKLKCYT